MEAITSSGEQMTHEELIECLAVLTGTEEVLDAIPDELDALQLADEVLGFDDLNAHEPVTAN